MGQIVGEIMVAFVMGVDGLLCNGWRSSKYYVSVH